jgi:hypothetical protein
LSALGEIGEKSVDFARFVWILDEIDGKTVDFARNNRIKEWGTLGQKSIFYSISKVIQPVLTRFFP